MLYGSYANARNWNGQLQNWLAVKQDTALTDTSAVLQSFKARAAVSRFAYLTNIEEKLVTGDIGCATTQLGLTPAPICPTLKADTVTGVEINDDSTMDYLVDTYKEFYGLYKGYITKSMSGADSARVEEIGELCPIIYGPVVYQARALYTAVYQEVRLWMDTCTENADTAAEQGQGGQRPAQGNTVITDEVQQYKLYPNPNDGNMVIAQMMADTNIVAALVTDIAGRVVYGNVITFKEGYYQLGLNQLAQGMYLMQLTDSNGRKYNFKFVKQ